MHRLLAAVILLGLTACADNQLARTGAPLESQKEPQAAPEEIEEKDEAADCNFVEQVASYAMQARQLGVPASETLQIARDHEEKNVAIARLAKMIIQDAYQRPQYTSDESRNAEVAAFGDHWATQCTKNEIAGL